MQDIRSKIKYRWPNDIILILFFEKVLTASKQLLILNRLT